MLNLLVNRPIAVTMSLIALLVLGAVSATLLPVSLVPDVDIPQVTVQVSAPNTSARELDEAVIKPLRQQLIQVAHLSDIRTESKDGTGTILLRFEQGVDIDYLFVEVNEKVDRAMSSLPRDLERPKVVKASATDIPAFYINMTLRDDSLGHDTRSPLGDVEMQNALARFAELSNFANQVIIRRIEQLPEVAMVDKSGLVYPELLIVPDPVKLQLLGITSNDLSDALLAARVDWGNLTIRDGIYRYSVRFDSQVEGRESIEQLYLKINNRLYQIRELAEVREQSQSRTGMVQSDGKDAVTLAVIKQSDAQMASLKEGISDLLVQFERDYPQIDFEVTRDQTELLEYSIDNLVQNIFVGALLACVIIFLFMKNLRTPLLVVLTIPLALIISLLVFHLIGLTINIISLSGLVLGLGMMVDNSIIVIDNISFRWQNGYPLRQAVVKGASEVFAPMLSSVLTTCAVFVPLIFLSGIAGALFYDQAMAVCISLFSSLMVTVTVIPVYYYLLYRHQTSLRANRFLQRYIHWDVVALYDRILKWFFRRRAIMWSLFLVSMLGIWGLFIWIPKAKLPPLSHNDILVTIEWNERVSVTENTRRCNELLQAVSAYTTQTTVMAGVQQFILSHTHENTLTESIVYMKSKDVHEVAALESAVGEYLSSRYPDAVYQIGSSGNIFELIFADQDAVLVARLRPTGEAALDPTHLNELLGQISQKIQRPLQPVAWQEHVLYVPQPDRMALYGVAYEDLLGVIRKGLNSNTLFTIVQGSFHVPVVMGEDQSDLSGFLEHLTIAKDSVVYPLSVFLKETRSRDLKNIISGPEGDFYPLALDVEGRDVPRVMQLIEEVVSRDDRFDVSFSGTYFSNREMVGELVVILVVSILLLFLILASQFESLIQPLIILSELIIDLFGALVVMWIFGVSLNIMSLIGIVIMCGIVINDSILKIDTINKLRGEGFSLIHAIFEAGRRRLSPILMTSLTTILSIAPFLVRGSMGSDLQYPLSLALIGGMVVGTLVSIFFVPLAYYEIYKNSK